MSSNHNGREEQRRRMTLEGMTDIEAGQFTDHKSVQACAENLSTDKPLPVPR